MAAPCYYISESFIILRGTFRISQLSDSSCAHAIDLENCLFLFITYNHHNFLTFSTAWLFDFIFYCVTIKNLL